MKHAIWIRALVFSCGVAALQGQMLSYGNPEQVGMSAARLGRLDEVVPRSLEEGGVPGAVVLVARRGKIVYRKAFGHRALLPEREAMTADTIFDVASLTKVMATATSIMILVEEGKISLSDPVARYLPAFGRHDKDAITILQLLTHHSGLRPDLDLNTAWSGYETALERAFDEQLVAAPGEEFIYSDINYLVLGEVVRALSGMHLHEFSAARIFEPLGMTDTGFLPPAGRRVRIAPTERREQSMLRGVVHDPTAFRMGGCAGHAGLFSTVDDSAVFLQMILNGGAYGDTRILSPLSVASMTTAQSPPASESRRGIGFDILSPYSSSRGDLFPEGSFGHTGFTGTSFWIDPYDGVFVLIFSSRLHPEGEGDVVPLRKRVASVAAASLMEIEGPLPENQRGR